MVSGVLFIFKNGFFHAVVLRRKGKCIFLVFNFAKLCALRGSAVKWVLSLQVKILIQARFIQYLNTGRGT